MLAGMFALVCLILALATLLVGGAGSVPGFSIASTGLLTLGLLSRVYRRINNPFLTRATLPGGWICLLVMLWVAISALPVPDVLAGGVRTAENEAARAVMGDLAQPRFALSRNRMGTLRVLLLLAGICGAWSLASGMAPARKRQLLGILVLMGVAVAIAGLVNQHVFVRQSHIWWTWLVPESDPVACFVRREYYVAYLALLMPVTMALAASATARRKALGIALWGSAFLILALAIAVSYSRVAALTAAIGLLGIAVGGTLLVGSRRGLALCLLTVLALVLVGIVAGLGGIEHRPGLREPQSIGELWREAGCWRDHPLIGAGAEGFRAKSANATHAPFLAQVRVDGGIIGSTLLLLWALLALRQLVAGMGREGGKTVTLAAWGAIWMAFLHGLSGSPAYLALYGITLATIVGCLARPPNTAKTDASIQTLLGERIAHRQILQLRCLAACLPLVLLIVLPFGAALQPLDDPGHLSRADRPAAIRALGHAPGLPSALKQARTSP
jgi:hypothetical protein